MVDSAAHLDQQSSAVVVLVHGSVVEGGPSEGVSAPDHGLPCDLQQLRQHVRPVGLRSMVQRCRSPLAGGPWIGTPLQQQTNHVCSACTHAPHI